MFKHHKPADSASSVCGVRVYMSQLVLLSVSRSQALAGRLLPGNKPFCWSSCSWLLYVLYIRLNNSILYIFVLIKPKTVRSTPSYPRMLWIRFPFSLAQWPTGKLTWLNGFHRAQENTYLCKNRWTGNHKYLYKLIFKIWLDSQLVISQFSIIVHMYDVHKKSVCMYKVWEKNSTNTII